MLIWPGLAWRVWLDALFAGANLGAIYGDSWGTLQSPPRETHPL